MSANSFGRCFQITTFGESHGPALGVVIEGCPAGVPFSWDLIRENMARRRPGRFPWMSSRKETDEVELLSGVFEGRTLGTPLALIVRNQDARSEDYENIKSNPRPGHADDVWKKKFGHVDPRGGGRASGRETLSRVLGGTVAQMFLDTLLQKIKVKAQVKQVGPFVRESSHLGAWFGEKTQEVEQFLIAKKLQGLSYGGMIEMRIEGLPIGLGQPVFRKLKADLASAFMGIGACYEVRLGSYELNLEEGSDLHGKKGVYGGVRGGISTGEPCVFQLKFKPPSSVLEVAKKGRHDPCIVPRAAVVVEAMAYLVIADHVLWSEQDSVSYKTDKEFLNPDDHES